MKPDTPITMEREKNLNTGGKKYNFKDGWSKIILDYTEFIKGGIGFDTYKAQQIGYSETEIAFADHLLTYCSF